MGLPRPILELAYRIPGVGVRTARISIPALPLSANAQWVQGRHSTFLHPDAKTYKKMMKMAIEHGAHLILPLVTQTFGVMIILESQKWLEKSLIFRGKSRRKDVDNLIKPTLDALVEAVGSNADHNCWDVHAFKLVGREERTTIYIYPRPLERLI